MKRFSSLILILMFTLIVSACGARAPEAAPTVNVVELQSTMAAAALTMVAETQAAIPTATPLPPTPTLTITPAIVDTPLPVPFAELSLTPATSENSGGGDPCINQALPAELKGQPVKVRLNNTTKAALAITVYLQTDLQGQCGYRTYSVDPQGSVVINGLVQGCYTIWAWNKDPEAYFIVTNGTTCINSSDTWVFSISNSSIKLRN
jgi:hypothetical protein